jgi:hypothetical protein
LETAKVQKELELAIADAQPLFGAETGELVDFTSGAVKLKSFGITSVKPPLVGEAHPSKIHASLTVSLKDLTNELERQEWLKGLGEGLALYIVGFEKQPGAEEKENVGITFREQYGIKLVRGLQIAKPHDAANKGSKSFYKKIGEDHDYELSVELDPVQYKQDLEKLVVSKSKFIEDIYSTDC